MAGMTIWIRYSYLYVSVCPFFIWRLTSCEAGLFSAVVTAFGVEAYKWLLPDTSAATQQILLHISMQLSQLPSLLQACNHDAANCTLPLVSQVAFMQFSTPDSAVWINSLWYASLVCSLISASLGILIKQWLKQYIAEDYSVARQSTRIREHRFQGLRHWSIPHIIAFLPLLLRISLTLFLIGLVIFLKTLHYGVMCIVAVLVATWLTGYIASILLPAAFPGCPYKSPEAKFFYILAEVATKGLTHTRSHWTYLTWGHREASIKNCEDLDYSTLVTADVTFADRHLADTVQECIKDLSTQDSLLLVHNLIRSRLHLQASFDWAIIPSSAFSRITKRAFESFMLIFSHALQALLDQQDYYYSAKVLRDIGKMLRQYKCVDNETTFDHALIAILGRVLRLATDESVPTDARIFLPRRLVEILIARPQLCRPELADSE